LFIVQHISGEFSGRLAARLDRECDVSVLEAVDGDVAEPGRAYLSPGGRHLRVARRAAGLTMELTDEPPVNSCRPSADVLFESAAHSLGANALAIVLTGIGSDGREGCRELSLRGATILVQDEPSSAVWGMPGSVVRAGLATEEVSIATMADRVRSLLVADR
jgi:two-component system chemotaxis response regulator CheB